MIASVLTFRANFRTKMRIALGSWDEQKTYRTPRTRRRHAGPPRAPEENGRGRIRGPTRPDHRSLAGREPRLDDRRVVGLPPLEGDHRLYRVASWVPAPPGPRRGCLGRQGRPRDLAADRLATLLSDLADAARWGALARAFPPSVRRVDDVPGRLGRVDLTTAAASVTPAGLCQRGHSQDHRPELPPGQAPWRCLEPSSARR